MKKELFRFLKEYTTNVEIINKLIVSSFLLSKSIKKVKNKHIGSLLIREGDDEFSKLELFNSKFKIDTLEKVIEAFEYVISPEDKVVSGAVYTPSNIREFILDDIFSKINNFENITICDPACGCSGFLFSAIQKIRLVTNKNYKDIIENNIFGLDIKDYAIERSKILLTLLTIDNGEEYEEISFKFFVGNALSNHWKEYIDDFKGFDVVVGNPPYVCSRNIDSESKNLLMNWSVSSTGHPDLYIPFFEIGMTILKKNGYLGFITMNSFYKSLNGRALRDYLSIESYKLKIIDFGSNQVFTANNTYTCICLLQKKKEDFVFFASSNKGELSDLVYSSIPYLSLNNYNGWNLKFHQVIKKIESIGKPFSTLFKTSSGIATLKNDVYIFDSVFEDDDFFYIDEQTPIEKKVCKEVLNTNKLTKITNLELLKRKVIFPYFYRGNSAFLISESDFKKNYPNAYSYLLRNKDLLSTRDKGNGKYEEWFAYGRNQSLEKYKFKLFFPHIAPNSPNFVINNDEELFFHNGLSLLDNDLSKIKLAQKIMSSRLFWFYIESTSKPYGAGYMSLSKNYIKSFGIYDFTVEEKNWLINEERRDKINEFIEKKYDIKLEDIC
ncbi:N-6 DNA methylase [Pseudoalteromonas sp. A601]|uniref:Eco57I restriction-modification methylase domain-containing protein n=1 Tax=Pseudoalteromonas sp. A601 TaxID=1967839 RepID=UPI000B3CAEC9|nr:N-6 DNA methylase [Pseudoalteromonas sp. A601]OUS67678.1 N-6 DNA methylase [Pseudoalteromonas sp. A601]